MIRSYTYEAEKQAVQTVVRPAIMRWYMGVSVGHCFKKNSVYIPPKWKC